MVNNMRIVLLTLSILLINTWTEAKAKSLGKIDNAQIITPKLSDDLNNNELSSKIRHYIVTQYLTSKDLDIIPKDERIFQFEQIDLNNDGKKEIFINFKTSYFCGNAGCNMVLLSHDLRPITKFTIMRTPLLVRRYYKNGWRVIMVESNNNWRALEYKNGKYPSNPSLAKTTKYVKSMGSDALFSGANNGHNVVIARDYSF